MLKLENYSTTGTLRSEFPTIETTVGTMAYWRSLRFGDYGWTYLGGFEPPYNGKPGEANQFFTVNGVEYSGEIRVFLNRQGNHSLEYSSVNRVGDWRKALTDSAMKKIEAEFLPLALELFPIPTTEHIAFTVHSEASSEARSAITSALHSLSVKVYHDKRYEGFQQALKDGFLAGMESAITNVTSESFSVNTRY